MAGSWGRARTTATELPGASGIRPSGRRRGTLNSGQIVPFTDLAELRVAL
ncbi:hypothetical protein ACGFNV_05580 [Streptomyces sp. NPDC048751]